MLQQRKRGESAHILCIPLLGEMTMKLILRILGILILFVIAANVIGKSAEPTYTAASNNVITAAVDAPHKRCADPALCEAANKKVYSAANVEARRKAAQLEAAKPIYIQQSLEKVRATLRDPESAKFEGVFLSVASGIPVVCGRVNAKNGLADTRG
jgi:hypothetical protein